MDSQALPLSDLPTFDPGDPNMEVSQGDNQLNLNTEYLGGLQPWMSIVYCRSGDIYQYLYRMVLEIMWMIMSPIHRYLGNQHNLVADLPVKGEVDMGEPNLDEDSD